MLSFRSFTLLFGCVFLYTPIFGQISNGASYLVISPGTYLVVTGDVLNQNGGTITNNGTLVTTASIINANGSTLRGNGNWQLQGNWNNAGTFTAGSSTVLFSGSDPSSISAGTSPFFHLQFNKTANDIALASAVTANGNVQFLSNQNHVLCSGFNFKLSNSGALAGAGSDNFFVTDGNTGGLERPVSTQEVLFPIGSTTGSYNPVTLTGAAGIVRYKVGVQTGFNYPTGDPDYVNRQWNINRLGGEIPMTATFQWNSPADEAGAFDAPNCHTSRWNGADWEGFNNGPADCSGGVCTRTQSGVDAFSTFGIGSGVTFDPCITEICGNGLDDDCDGLIDEDGTPLTWYADADGDGYGDLNNSQTSCQKPAGYVRNSLDCNDADATLNSGSPEICNGIDDDCDGLIDDADPDITGQDIWYADADGDGYGNAAFEKLACIQPVGFVSNDTDRDDANAAVHPGAVEVCNGIDDDCNGLYDNFDPGVTGQPVWYADVDKDGFGNPAVSLLSCFQPKGYVSDHSDCNDTNAAVNPSAAEICGNNVDDDCDGEIDEEGTPLTWWIDADGDGYGYVGNFLVSCSQPFGYVTNNTDCNDDCATCHPNAPEICDNYDNNCDGQFNEGFIVDSDGDGMINCMDCAPDDPTLPALFFPDADGDGYSCWNNVVKPGPNSNNVPSADCNGYYGCNPPAGYVRSSFWGDCDDNDPALNLDDLDGDGYSTCNGDCDDNDPAVPSSFYLDADNDGFGSAADVQFACAAPPGYVTNDQDCDDTNPNIYPGTTEICNGMDDNCDGNVDEGFTDDADSDGILDCIDCAPNDPNFPIHFYADADGDGFGDPYSSVLACTAPVGYVTDHTDCNDVASAFHPGATEICNGFDDDCNGSIDESGAAQHPDFNALMAIYNSTNGPNWNHQTGWADGAAGISCNVCGWYGVECNVNGRVERLNLTNNNLMGILPAGPWNLSNLMSLHLGYNHLSGSIPAAIGNLSNLHFLTLDVNQLSGSIPPEIGNLTHLENFLLRDNQLNGSIPPELGNLSQLVLLAISNNQLSSPIPAQLGNLSHLRLLELTNNQLSSSIPPELGNLSALEGLLLNNNQLSGSIPPELGDLGALERMDLNNNQLSGSIPPELGNLNALTNLYLNDNQLSGCFPQNLINLCGATLDFSNNPGLPGSGDIAAFCANGIGVCPVDGDGDGYSVADDCDDANAAINPGATEICDGLDNDCDGLTDEGVLLNFYADTDGDGYGNTAVTIQACAAPGGYVLDHTDCDDTNSNRHPGMAETCNGVDDDCDGLIDEGVAFLFYADSDGDGYGNPAISQTACAQPTGYVGNANDCNDGNSAVHPGVLEICDGIDNDCNGLTDSADPNVLDSQPPLITCPANQTVAAGSTCGGTVGAWSLVSKTDNCTVSSAVSVAQSPASGTALSGHNDATTVSLTANDGNGNTASCSFTVTLKDVAAPTLNCPADRTLNLNVNCQASLANYISLSTVSDNCTAAAAIVRTQSPATGSVLSGVGVTIVTIAATDAVGNASNCTFNVNRTDVILPSITCPTPQTLELGAGCQAALLNYSSLATASDNCTASGNLIKTQISPAPGTIVNGLGTTLVSLRATDAAGRSKTCTFNVTRVDNVSPFCGAGPQGYTEHQSQQLLEKQVAIEEMDSTPLELEIFPNPTDGRTYLRLHGLRSTADLSVFDPLGRIVWQQKEVTPFHTMTLDLSEKRFVSGLYYITVRSEGSVAARWLLVEK